MPFLDLSKLQQFVAVKINEDQGAKPGKVQIPQCAQVELWFSTPNTRTAKCILHGRYVGAFDTIQADVLAAYNALVGHASTTALMAHIAPTFNLYAVGVRDLNAIDQPLITASGSKPGTSTGTALPVETALVITLHTTKAGKSGRGRIYVPGWATTALGSNDTVAAAAVTALTNWATGAIPSMMQALTFTHTLGLKERVAYTSPVTGTAHPARPATTLDITSYTVNNTWDTQRKRGQP